MRVDSGISTGDVITGSFDSLLAKLIVSGATRKDAVEKSRRALQEFEITGLPTVIPFHRVILEEPAFVAETDDAFAVHTTWIETEFANEIEPWHGAIEDGFGEDELYRTIVVEVEGRRLRVGVPAGIFAAGEHAQKGKPPKRDRRATSATTTGLPAIIAPMQSTVVKVLVSDGQRVLAGDVLCILEAMKMEQPVLAEASGTIAGLSVIPGDVIQSGQVIAVLEPILESD